MPDTKATYTLWTIPGASWSHALENVTLSEQEQELLVEFATKLDDNRLKERLRPYNTPVTKKTLSKSTGY